MKFQRSCEHCLHNFSGFCTAKGFGQAIESDDSSCELWEINEEYLAQIADTAPWYLKKPYDSGKLSQKDFLLKLEQDSKGLPVELNIYDAIEEAYGIDQKRIAEILGVSSDVVGYARAKGTVARRIPHFSKCLCIPEEFFREFTTEELPAMELCFEEYKKRNEKPEFLD